MYIYTNNNNKSIYTYKIQLTDTKRRTHRKLRALAKDIGHTVIQDAGIECLSRLIQEKQTTTNDAMAHVGDWLMLARYR